MIPSSPATPATTNPHSHVSPVSSTSASAGTDTNALASRTTPTSTSHLGPRLILWGRDVAVWFVLAVYLTTLLLQHSYTTYLQPLADSYRRQPPSTGGYHADFANDFTYYSRHCSELDISTESANDLLVTPDQSADEAAARMLRHGALAFTQVLDNSTVQELRTYLASRHAIRKELSWNEVFWDGEEGTRLSLGIGTHDHPAIARALQQIGRHEVLKRSLEGILGDDPAIVEVSTLTALNGAHSQGLHTDTDYWGSSLQHARTFLHSYSFFVALQDTPQSLGATTVCPGSHYCADEDLVDLCEEHAFSVSTNGHTGPEHGVLKQGDAFLFNQNTWHRGPAVLDEGTDRIMFILTFVTRNKASPSDRRQQGLGTFYYQRWNMWASTFNYLRDASHAMAQPWSGLRALGLYHPSGRNIGQYWWETFCQQLSAGDMFYASHELLDFHEKVLDPLHFPDAWRSSATEWENFLPETLDIWVSVASQAYLAVLAASVSLWYVWRGTLTSTSSSANDHKGAGGVAVGRLVWIHAVLGGLFVASRWYIAQTPFAKSIQSGEIFVKPFPAPPVDYTPNTVGPSTFPERTDVLVSTRFDATFLASFNHFIDYHPGNEEWRSMVDLAATYLPPKQHSEAAQIIVTTMGSQRRALGYPSTRFLWQDYSTGAWRRLSDEQAVEETRRAILARAHPRLGEAWQTLKVMLAEARFGSDRDSETARTVTPYFVQDLTDALFDVHRNEFLKTQQEICHVDENKDATLSSSMWKDNFRRLLESLVLAKSSVDPTTKDEEELSPYGFDEGTLVWGRMGRDGDWMEATIVEESDDGRSYLVELFDGDKLYLSPRNLRSYLQVQEGDYVAVDFNNGEDFFAGTITFVKSNGYCSVLFDDGDYQENVRRHNILSLDEFVEDD